MILIFLIRDCITYFPFFFFKKSTRNFYFHRTFIHDHEHIENVPRDISNLDPFHVTIPSHCNSFLSLSLSLGFKNHSSKFRENLYSSVSHIHHLLFRHEHHSDAITKEIRVHPAFSSLILSRQGCILTYINPHWSVITRSRREGKCGVFAYGSRGQICGALCQFG